MFLELPFKFHPNIQNTVLIINTVLLLAVLIIIEIVYSERPKNKGKDLVYLSPIILVFVGILIFAIVKQIGKV
jgi:hypothetical protein